MSSPASDLSAPRIAVVVATYKRPAIVARLVKSLATETSVGVICIVDNGSDRELKPTLEQLDARVQYADAGQNLGCGGGISQGIKNSLPDQTVTHFWILDDDVVLEPGCANKLIAAMRGKQADLAVPLIADGAGNVGSFPGPLPGRAWGEIKKTITPDQFMQTCGTAPLAFTWSPGVCVLVTRRAVEACGRPRTDYWLMGEDIEFTARLTAKFKAVLVPEARAHHLPPVALNAESDQAGRYAYVKFCAHLTNNTYTAIVLPHGRRLIRHLPGNYLRFLRENKWAPRALFHAVRCFYWGTARMPAGSARFQAFRAAMTKPAN